MLHGVVMLAGSVLLLLLATAENRRTAEDGARAELEVCAGRIEELKARDERSAELDRLLRRAQELAARLERAVAASPLGEEPSAEELRERADAARDEVDRLAADIAALDVRIGDARRSRGEPGAGVERAALGGVPPPADRVHALQAERAALSVRRARAEAEAARLDAEARAADRDR